MNASDDGRAVFYIAELTVDTRLIHDLLVRFVHRQAQAISGRSR
jgi:hypothetical protein